VDSLSQNVNMLHAMGDGDYCTLVQYELHKSRHRDSYRYLNFIT